MYIIYTLYIYKSIKNYIFLTSQWPNINTWIVMEIKTIKKIILRYIFSGSIRVLQNIFAIDKNGLMN